MKAAHCRIKTTRKFKLGQRVRITGRIYGHHLQIGSICTIAEVREHTYLVEDGPYSYYLTDAEMESAESKIVDLVNIKEAA